MMMAIGGGGVQGHRCEVLAQLLETAGAAWAKAEYTEGIETGRLGAVSVRVRDRRDKFPSTGEDHPMPVSTVERPVSALRQRMLENMAVRDLRSDTQRDYVRMVRSFAAFLGHSPDTATAEGVRRFQVHQRESGVQPPTTVEQPSAMSSGAGSQLLPS
jgi:hypothetical protein